MHRDPNSSKAECIAGGDQLIPDTQIELLDFLTLLIEKLDRKDLFDYEVRCTLRLVSQEIRNYLDAVVPFEELINFHHDPHALLELPLKHNFTKTVKHLNMGVKMHKKYALALVKSHLPELESLAINSGNGVVDLIMPSLAYWKNLTSLKLCHDKKPERIFTILGKSPICSNLKSFGYSSTELVEPYTVSGSLSQLTALTRLDLQLEFDSDYTSDVWDIFYHARMDNLEDLVLRVGFIGDDDDYMDIPFDIDINLTPEWPNLTRFALLNSNAYFTGYLLHAMQDMSFIKHLKALEIEIPEYIPNRFQEVFSQLGAAGCLEELDLRGWKTEYFEFKGIPFNSLKKLKLTQLRSLSCYEDLAEAMMPALESLEITDWLRPPADMDSFLSNHKTSPFPNLRYLNWRGAVVLSPSAVKFISPLLPRVKELVLHPINGNGLEYLFGKQIKETVGSNSSPLWPCLMSFDFGGCIKLEDLQVLKLLPAQCPSLESISINNNAAQPPKGYTAKLTKSLRQAARQGIWSRLKSVHCYHGQQQQHVQIWPIK